MALPMETVGLGAPVICPTCGVRLVVEVLKSVAGYYVGFFCCYGPCGRESGYYRSYEDAEKAINTGSYSR